MVLLMRRNLKFATGPEISYLIFLLSLTDDLS